jgi:hypothetical protein
VRADWNGAKSPPDLSGFISSLSLGLVLSVHAAPGQRRRAGVNIVSVGAGGLFESPHAHLQERLSISRTSASTRRFHSAATDFCRTAAAVLVNVSRVILWVFMVLSPVVLTIYY